MSRERVLRELVPRVVYLARQAKASDLSFTIDPARSSPAARGARLWIVGPPSSVDAVVASLPLADPQPRLEGSFPGLIETEVVAIDMPANGVGAPR